MAIERSFLIKLFADPAQVLDAFGKIGKEAGDAFGAANRKVNEIAPGLQKIALLSAAAFAGLAAFATKAASAAIEDEAEQAKLAKTLQNVVGATKSAVAETEAFIKAQSRQKGFTDSELRPSIEALVRTTGDLGKAQQQTILAQDIARSTGASLTEVATALARANVDNFRSLTALSPALRDNVKEGQSLDQVFAELQATFGGAAQAAAGTTAGQLQILKNSLSEATEAIGVGLIPALSAVIGPLTKFAQLVEDNASIFSAVTISLLTFTGLLVAAGIGAKVYAIQVAIAAGATRLFGQTISASGVGAFLVGFSLLVGAAALLATKLFAAEKATKALQSAVAGSDGIIRAAGSAYIYVTGEVIKLNSSLSRTVNVLDTQSRRLEALAGAYGITTFKTGQFKSETGGAAKAVVTAKEKIAQYTQVLKSAQGASDAFGASQKRVTGATESVADANDALKVAQDALAKAQQGGSPEQIAAGQRAVAAAERTVARSKFSHEEAIIAVRDAERKLAEVRADPEATADERRKAEIDLAEAKFNVADSEDRQFETTSRLAAARRDLRIATTGLIEGDAELLPLQTAVEVAQKNQRIAAEQLTEAINDQAKALENYGEALQALADVAKLFPKIASNRPAEGLIPMPPTIAPGTGGGGGGGQRNLPDKVEITVNSSIVNPLQVAQEIQDYLDQLNRAYGTYAV